MLLDSFGRCARCGRNPFTEDCVAEVHEAHDRYWRTTPAVIIGQINRQRDEAEQALAQIQLRKEAQA